MKTFLPQNKFYSTVPVPAVDEAGASSPAPTPDAPADLSCSDVEKPCLQGKAAIDSCQEPVAADFENDMEQLLGVAGKPSRKPARRRLKLPRFAPDYEGMEAAMNDPDAPRLRADDPMWTDASPLFLKEPEDWGVCVSPIFFTRGNS